MLSDTMMLGGGRKAAYPIDNSLLFRGSQYLTRTPTVEGNRKTWTFSAWVRLSALSGNHEVLHAAQDRDNCVFIMYSNQLLVFQQYVGNILTINLGGEAKIRDPGGWMNIVVSVDTTQDSPLDRARLFINGVLQQQVALPDQNSDTWVNTTYTHYIGRYSEYGANFWDGYLAEPIFVDGAALDSSYFGQIDPVTGSWRPKRVALTGSLPVYSVRSISGLTPIGTFSTRASAGIDGVTSQTQAASPYAGAVTTGWFGIDWGSAQVVSGFDIWATNNQGFDGANYGAVTFDLYGNTVNNTGTATLIGTVSVTTHVNGQMVSYRGSNTTAYQYTWIKQTNAAAQMMFAEAQFLTTATTNAYGTNGFYLGKPWDAADLGADASGLGNHWAPVGFAASDVMGDSPTNVACVLNPLASPFISSTTASFADGNLVLTNGTGVGYAVAIGTLAIPNSGKWVFRVDKPVTPSGGGLTLANTYWFAGVVAISQVGRRPGVEGLMWTAETGYAGVSDNGCVCNFGTAVTGKPAVSVSATYELMVDFDEGIITIKKDGDTYYSGVLANPGEWVLPIVYIYNAATTTVHFVDFTASAADYKNICTANLPATTGQTSGTFTGNVAADGPCVFTGAVPETLSVNGNPVTWGTHADKLATGFKIRSASTDYNASGANSWVATYDKKPTVGPKNRAPANAQGNP